MEGKTLAGAVAATALLVILIGVQVLHAGGVPPAPDRPPPPPSPEAMLNSQLKFSPSIYQGMLGADAKSYEVPAPTLEEMRQPFPYFEEVNRVIPLKKGKPIETAHLRLTITVGKAQARIEGQPFRSDHMILRIQNLTPRFLAYNVATQVADKRRCNTKGDLPHNAIVIEPNQTIERTECLYRSDESVDLVRVEVIELPPLAAYYVSRIPTNVTIFDARTAAGHLPLAGKTCPQTFSWQELKQGLAARDLGWRDVIDFYARHNCDEYSFFARYRYRTDPGAPLPARNLP